MQEPEIELHGGTHGPVVRVGDTVRRVPGAASQAIHALLRHLELVGFSGAPRCLGFDDKGREILTFIPGEVAVRSVGQPLPDYVRSDASLMQLGRHSRIPRCHSRVRGTSWRRVVTVAGYSVRQ